MCMCIHIIYHPPPPNRYTATEAPKGEFAVYLYMYVCVCLYMCVCVCVVV